MQYDASQENLSQTMLLIDWFLETMPCSHTKLLKYCHKTQEVKKAM